MSLIMEQMPVVVHALNIGFIQTLKLFFVTLIGAIPLGLVIALGIFLGLLATWLVNRFVLRPLKRISEKESGSQADFIGMNATVTERIFAKGFGRISFVYEGNSISEPARSENGEEIPTGTSVVVLEVRDKVYIVQPLQ